MTLSSEENRLIFNMLYNCFSADPERYIVPKVHYMDGLGRKRTIDFAIIPRDPSAPRVAVLVQPNHPEGKKQFERDLELSIRLLCNQNWAPVIFASDEIIFQFHTVEAQLKQTVYQATPTVSITSEITHHLNNPHSSSPHYNGSRIANAL